MKKITDPSFKYVPAAKTDLTKTFARERARLKAEKTARESETSQHTVTPFKTAQGGRS